MVYIIILLVALLLIERCNNSGNGVIGKPDTVRTVDTVFIPVKGEVVTKPRKIDSIPYPVEKLVIPADYDSLKNQHIELALKHYQINVSLDTVYLVDTATKQSYGKVIILDSVEQNELRSHRFKYELTIPRITETVTIKEPYKPRAQLYVGGGITGKQTSPVEGAHVGLMFKNKKDQVYGVQVGAGPGGLQFGISSYWKIKF